MIRILHFADLHLGMENYGRLDPATGLSTRALDFLRVFDELIAYAVQTDGSGPVDLVLFAGDAFKTRDPSPTYQREFARRIHLLATTHGIPVFLLVGNHDVPNASGQAHSLEIFSTLEVPGVIVARRPDLFTIETRHGPLQIVAVPWVNRSALLTRDEYTGLNLDDLNQTMLSKLDSGLQAIFARVRPDAPIIMTVHGTVQGAMFGSERNVMLGHDLVLPRSLFDQQPPVSYVAMGHIHKHQSVGDDPPIVYAGSLERVDFGEASEEKGFVMVELDGAGSRARWQFQRVAARRFISLNIEARAADPTETIISAIERQPIADAVVKVIIRTTHQVEALIDDQRIMKALAPACYVTLSHDVERTARSRLSGDTESVEALTPEEVLKRYFSYRQATPERIERLLQAATPILHPEQEA